MVLVEVIEAGFPVVSMMVHIQAQTPFFEFCVGVVAVQA